MEKKGKRGEMGEKGERKGSPHTVSGNVNWYNHYAE